MILKSFIWFIKNLNMLGSLKLRIDSNVESSPGIKTQPTLMSSRNKT